MEHGCLLMEGTRSCPWTKKPMNPHLFSAQSDGLRLNQGSSRVAMWRFTISCWLNLSARRAFLFLFRDWNQNERKQQRIYSIYVYINNSYSLRGESKLNYGKRLRVGGRSDGIYEMGGGLKREEKKNKTGEERRGRAYRVSRTASVRYATVCVHDSVPEGILLISRGPLRKVICTIRK